MKSYYFFILLFSINLSAYASFPVKRTIDVITTENTSINDVDNSNTSTLIATVAGSSQIATLLLCWFFGPLGFHRFYLGDTWQGIVQLLTLGGLGVWFLIDFIRVCIGDLGPGW